MAERDTVFSTKLKHSGIISFKDLYEFIYDWLASENYDIFETRYVEKVKGESKDIEIAWQASKEISDYFRFMISVDWMVLGLKKVKVKKGDKEVSMDSAYIELKFKAVLVKDYENRWESHPFWKFLRGIYDRYIIRSRIDDYEIKLFEEVSELIAQVKAFLAIEGHHPT